MKIHLAIKSSQIHVAIRPSLLPPMRDRSGRRQFERENRLWEQPFVAASNLVRFDHLSGEPVYETRVYNNSGTPMALVLAKKLDDWEPLDRGDPITLLSDLAGNEQIVARQERITERKKELGIREGREWNDYESSTSIADIYNEQNPSANPPQQPPPQQFPFTFATVIPPPPPPP